MTKLTILCVSLTAYGHINATLGVACALRKRGHRIVFITERSFKGTFEKQGFEEQVFDEKEQEIDDDKAKEWRELIARNIQFLGSPSVEVVYSSYLKVVNDTIFANTRINEIVQSVRPNIILEDRVFMPMPAFISSGIPIVKLSSLNPLVALDGITETPSPLFHLSTIDNTEWEKYRKVTNEIKEKIWPIIKDYFKTLSQESGINYEEIFSTKKCREYQSTNLNTIMYPKQLIADYLKSGSLPSNFMILDHSMRECDEVFDLPEKLKTDQGKLIYFSFGTVGCSITPLIERFLGMLSKMNHRFIASLGQLSDTYKLPDNVWAAKFVPQLKVLPLVDLVLTHGGNNTFVEALYFGKPMIVFPMFGDQFDNAQRVIETNIGKTFNGFTVTENELKTAIDELLNDEPLYKRLSDISKQMKESDSMENVVNRIEYVAQNPKIPSVM